MTIEQIRHAHERQPFQPFVIRLADGRGISVLHREFMLAAPSGRTVIVMQPDDSWNIVDLLLAKDLEFNPRCHERESLDDDRATPNGA